MRKVDLSRKEKGIAIVEATVVLPVLLLLFLAICELGRAFYTYNTLNKTLQNGARYLSSTSRQSSQSQVFLDYNPPGGNAYHAQNLILYGDVNKKSKTVLGGLKIGDINFSIPAAGFIQIDVNYRYVPIVGPVLSSFDFGSDINMNFILNASVTVRAI